MKKFLVILLGIILIQNISIARDYTKLQIKEMQHAQKYNNAERHFKNYDVNQSFNYNTSVYDPGVINLGVKFEPVNSEAYTEKLQQDEVKYEDIEKTFNKITWQNYNSQAKGRDYYKVYRIAERIIRANRLDYQTWRIGIVRNTTDYNAYAASGNCIILYTSVIDTYMDNDDALALVIGHEFSHILLGHSQRKYPDAAKLDRMKRLAMAGNELALIHAAVLNKKMLADSKNMEYAADTEGAKLIAKAGYDLNKASNSIVFMEQIGLEERGDRHSTHPLSERRLESYNQNRRYFPTKIWKEIGRYNIYNTPALEATASSDRCTFVISPSSEYTNPNDFYRPESMDELNIRFGYTAYLNGEFGKSLEYFDNLIKAGTRNETVYLYASYAAYELYKQTKENKYKNQAINYIKQAESINPNNKYINKQAEELL